MLATAGSQCVTATIAGSGFQALREEWNELLRDSDADCLFLTWEWLHTWWQQLGEGRRLAITTVRSDGRLMGVAPWVVRSRAVGNGHPFEVLEFLGSGQVGSDYLDIIVRKGAEEAVCDAIAERMPQLRCVCKWANISSRACVAGVASRLHESGWSWGQAAINVAPYIPLAGKTWEAYLAELGSEHRYNYHRKLRRLSRDFTVRFEREDAIDLAIDLHNQRRSRLGGSDAFHTAGLTAFHRKFIGLASEQGWLRLYILRLNDQPAACLYGFLYHGKFYFYQSGLDPAYERYSPGMIAMGLAIQSAMQEGACEFDLLHGAEAYKRHWASESRSLFRIELFPSGALGRLFHSSLDFARSHRRVARGVLRNPQ